MPAKKAAKKAAAKKDTPAAETPANGISAVTPEVPAATAKEAPAKKAVKKAAKKEAAPKAVNNAPKPTKEKDVAKAAYLNYMNRKAKGLPGSPESDWLAAEKTEGS
jgi:hypothetical protein